MRKRKRQEKPRKGFCGTARGQTPSNECAADETAGEGHRSALYLEAALPDTAAGPLQGSCALQECPLLLKPGEHTQQREREAWRASAMVRF